MALGIFFFFGAVMATYAAITLLKPGTFLDAGWKLNPVAHRQMASMGRVIGIPFVFLASGLLSAGIGWMKRRRWGWTLATAIMAIQFGGDVVQVIGGDMKTAAGVVIAGLLLIYMTRPGVRAYFTT
jgi:hypothetical protein